MICWIEFDSCIVTLVCENLTTGSSSGAAGVISVDLLGDSWYLESFGIDESIEGLQLFEAVSKSVKTLKWEKI